MKIKLTKSFKDKIKKSFKRKDSILPYDLEGTFKVLRQDFLIEDAILVEANPTGMYKDMIVLPKHYEIIID